MNTTTYNQAVNKILNNAVGHLVSPEEMSELRSALHMHVGNSVCKRITQDTDCTCSLCKEYANETAMVKALLRLI